MALFDDDWCGNGVDIGGVFSEFPHGSRQILWLGREIHGKVQAIGGLLPMRWA